MNLKSILFLFSLVCCLLFIVSFASSKNIDLYFFFAQDCPYSAKIASALLEIQKQYPELKIYSLETLYNPQNQKLLAVLAESYGVKIEAVPVIFVGEKVIEGSGPNEVFQLKEEVRRCSISGCPSPIEKIKSIKNKPELNWLNISLAVGFVIFLIIFFLILFKKMKKSRVV